MATGKQLTKTQAAGLKPKAKRYEAWEGNGLGIRVSPTGHKTSVFVYHVGERARRMTLGTFPSMRVVKAHEAGTVADLIEEYVRRQLIETDPTDC